MEWGRGAEGGISQEGGEPVWRTGTRFNATQPKSRAQWGGSAVYIPIPTTNKI